MDWETTEVRVEEIDWECDCYQESEPMDWEDIPEVRSPKRSKVQRSPPALKKLNTSVDVNCNTSLQGEETQPFPKIWQRWSTLINQRTVRAPPVAERRSSSNWEVKILLSDVAISSSGWPRGISLVPPRVTRMWASYPSRPPGRHPAHNHNYFKIA
ncbi:hypothetical protein NPIL_18361 [Nephila pilipes]|uniref:Uncharacterized protein n=1 Tax=Nephila pilipes TaxID=299642 RepID=A0A8X6UEE5_NEPPI|nr:hypothetical protein NPIL_18361 [Nephila pilipes]